MKRYETPRLDVIGLCKEDIMLGSMLENIGTVVWFGSGTGVSDPGYEE